jgi:hypothetical protein
MKHAIFALALLPAIGAADDGAELARKIAEHQEGSQKLSERQDELAADVQQLIIEQTHPKVIELLQAVEDAMDEASGLLLENDTGGTTIAAETEVIEKIFEAAKERQQQQGGQSGSAMLDMMQQMKDEGKPGEKPGQKPGDKPGDQEGKGQGDQGGEGQTGDSDSANEANGGKTGGKSEERRVPKASGKAGQGLPREFQDALDAYNREAEKLAR